MVALDDGERLADACSKDARCRSPAAIVSSERASAGGLCHRGGRAAPTLVYRSDAFNEKLIAANATQIAGVVAPDLGVDDELAQPVDDRGRSAGLPLRRLREQAGPAVVRRAAQRLAPIRRSAIPSSRVSATHDVTPPLPFLVHQRTVLVGQSGMGKSTLVNALAPDAGARVGKSHERCVPESTRRRPPRSIESPRSATTAGSSIRPA